MARGDYQTVCINRKDEIGVLAELDRWLPIPGSSIRTRSQSAERTQS